MIRCNNCMTVFEDYHSLSKFIEIEMTDNIVVVPYIGQDFNENTSCVFDGCPKCMRDDYLMDVEGVKELAIN